MDFAPDWRVIPEEKVVLHKKIGEGVSAKVWLAEDKDTHELYAIKYFKASRTCYRQFCKEVKNLVLLNGHDPERMYVPKFHGIMKSRSKLCIVMELIQGRTVAHELAFSSHENVGLPMHLIRQLGSCVQNPLSNFMSSESIGMVHCDVKPENIVIVNEKAKERAVLIDFGLASKQHKMQAQENMYIQSRWYRSPEVLLGIQATIQADMWSLGCVLVEMFCGICPFRGKDSLDQMLLVVDAFGMPPEHMHERCVELSLAVSNPEADATRRRYSR
eukprot:763527-Hanusia_phi.AAC.8